MSVSIWAGARAVGTVLVCYACYTLPIYPLSHQRSLLDFSYVFPTPKYSCEKHSKSAVPGASRNFRTSRESLPGSPKTSPRACMSFEQVPLCYHSYPSTASRIPDYLSAQTSLQEQAPVSPACWRHQGAAPGLWDQLSCSGPLGSQRG